jgi:hypothetical protein
MITLSVAILAGFLAAQDKEQPTKYANNSFARVSYLAGGTFIQRSQDLGFEDAEINAPIAEGDRIGTTDGRMEIYLGRRTYLRLDQNTKIDFTSLPRRDRSQIRLRQWSGHLYLEAGELEREKAIEILTDDATFYVLDKGLYRINVRENGATEILVLQGTIEAAGADGSMLVKGAQRLALTEGRFDGRPSAFFASAAEDGFDKFNATRSAAVNRQLARRNLSGDLADFESELDEYGDWANSPEFGNVWIPRGMGADWHPYSMGRWMWIPMAGWTWIPYEPWGWGPFHYGRWQWAMNWGWYWIPMNIWGPAWVDWWWDYDFYGWAPMSYWGYPGILYNNRYYGRGWNGDYPHNSRAMTVVRKDQLQARNVHKYAVNEESLKSLGKINMSAHFPDARPVPSTGVGMRPLEGGRYILRKSGESAGGSRTVDTSSRRISGGETKSGEIKSSEAKGADGRRIDTRSKGEAGQAGATAKTGTANSGERKIRKKDGESSSYSSLGSTYRRYSYGSSSSSSSSKGSSSSSGSSSSGTSSRSGSSSSGRSSSGSSSRGSSSGSHSSGGGGHRR